MWYRQGTLCLRATLAILFFITHAGALPAPPPTMTAQVTSSLRELKGWSSVGAMVGSGVCYTKFKTKLIKMRLRNREQILELDDHDIARQSLFSRPQSPQEWADLMTSMFPLWILWAVVLGLYQPKTVNWLRDDGITLCVGATMVFTGMTLDPADFVRIFNNPAQVFVGCMCQYTLMPLCGHVISKMLAFPKDIAAGLILLSSCPGGTSSNLITLIAKGDVALSVLMTTASTVLASVLTPAIVAYMAGSLVQIDSMGLIKSTLQVVLCPVAVGLCFDKLLPGVSKYAKRATPLVSVMLVSLICGSVISRAAAEIRGNQGLGVLVGVTLLHAGGFFLGYKVPEKLGYDHTVCRTTSIETGIQSSALAVVLATRHFPDPVLTALPGALSSPAQSILGSLMAMYWYMQDVKAEAKMKDLERKKRLVVKRTRSEQLLASPVYQMKTRLGLAPKIVLPAKIE